MNTVYLNLVSFTALAKHYLTESLMSLVAKCKADNKKPQHCCISMNLLKRFFLFYYYINRYMYRSYICIHSVSQAINSINLIK